MVPGACADPLGTASQAERGLALDSAAQFKGSQAVRWLISRALAGSREQAGELCEAMRVRRASLLAQESEEVAQAAQRQLAAERHHAKEEERGRARYSPKDTVLRSAQYLTYAPVPDGAILPPSSKPYFRSLNHSCVLLDKKRSLGKIRLLGKLDFSAGTSLHLLYALLCQIVASLLYIVEAPTAPYQHEALTLNL